MATTTTLSFDKLPRESSPFTRTAIIKAADLTDSTNASVQTVAITIPANSRIEDVILDVVEGFKDDSDATFDDVTVSVKDNAGTPIVFVAAKQVAALNGTPIYFAAMDKAAVAGQVYTSAAVLNIAFTPESGKNLAALDRGEVRVHVVLQQRGQIS